jgi:hypothetical protein
MRIKNAPRHRCALEGLEDRRLLSAAIQNGADSDLLYDAANQTTWVAYYDSARQSLKVRSRVDGGAWSAEDERDYSAGTQLGRYPSIARSNNGTIGVAYYDATNGALKYIERDASSGAWSTPIQVDGDGRTGSYPSLAYNNKNNPFISYWTDVNDNGNDILRLINKNGTAGWGTATPIDSGPDVGRYSSMVFTANGWAMSYVTQSGTRYAYQSGSSKVIENIDTAGAGAYTSLALDANGKPWVAYYRSSDTRVMVAKKVTSSWQTQSVFGSKGYNVNFWFEPNGADARLVFKDATSPLNVPPANNVRKFNYTSGVWQVNGDPDTILFNGVSDGVSAVRGANGNITFTAIASIQTADNPAAYSQTLQVRDQADASIGMNWPAVTQSALNPAPGGSNPGVVFNGQLWLVGQATSTSTRDDAWYSSDNGVTWTNATANLPSGAAFGFRFDHELTVFNGELWVTGGYDGRTYFGDAWHSSDGVTWTQAASGAFTARSNHAAVVNGGRLYVIGGYSTAAGRFGDVWSTADGVTWQQDVALAPFPQREMTTAVSYEGRIWLIGGNVGGSSTVSNDVWSSADGVNWIQISAVGNFTKPFRYGGVGLVFDNRMWYLGGRNSANNICAEIYYSVDGLNWVQSGTLPDPRDGAAGMVFNDGMWLIGGLVPNQGTNHDVLYSNP